MATRISDEGTDERVIGRDVSDTPAVANRPASGHGPLRILFLIDELEALHGGSEQQVIELIKMLARSGEQVELAILHGTEWLTEKESGCPIHFCELDSFLSASGMRGLWKLARWIRAKRFDVVQTMFWEANLLGPPLAKMSGVPIVLGSRRNLNYWMSRRVAFLQSISNLFATRLIANSQAVRKVVALQEKTSEDKIDVLYNGIDFELFVPSPELRAKTRIGLCVPLDAFVAGYIATFRPVKGIEVLVRAAAIVKQRSQNVFFIFVGDGPTLDAMKDLAAELGVNHNCIFAGAHRNVLPFLSAFDAGVLPSHSEGFSNSLLEYMAAGLPVVATDVGGNRETLEQTGLLVPPNNPDALAAAITSLLDNRGLCQRLGHAAQTRVREQFSISKTQELVHKYFKSLAIGAGLGAKC